MKHSINMLPRPPGKFSHSHKSTLPLPVMAAILAAAVLMAGCGLAGNRPSSTIPDVYTGFGGIDVSFARESVPSTVFSGNSYDVVLLIANNGAATSDKAIVSLKDSKNVFTFKPKQASSDFIYNSPVLTLNNPLPGKNADPAGYLNSVILAMDAKSGVLAVGEEKKDTDIRADICYGYQTKLTANVCVDASTYSFQKQRKPCDYKAPIVFSKGQGAPVAVKRIETLDPDRSGGSVRPRFKIYIGNVGIGVIIDQGKLELFCTDQKQASKDTSPKINVVRIDNVELNGKSLGKGIQCSDTLNGKTEKVLDGNLAKDYITCEYQGDDFADGSGAFATPLQVELSYGYTLTSVPIPVSVEKGIIIASGAPGSASAPPASVPYQNPASSTTSGTVGSQPAANLPASEAPPMPPPIIACGKLNQDCDEQPCCAGYNCDNTKGVCMAAP